jgi:hypothetical protein
MRKAVVGFADRLRTEDADGAFYFAGHGAQVEGVNYLVPIDGRENQYRNRAAASARLSLNDILGHMAQHRPGRLSIVILDACRNNPLKSRGLANIRHALPKGAPFFLAYATSPDDVAFDSDKDGNGPYASALALALKKPWLPIDRVFAETHETVVTNTGAQQFPWYTRSFSGEFYFRLGDENDFWRRIRNSEKPEQFTAFLGQFANGRFARNACIRALELAELENLSADQRHSDDLALLLRERIAEAAKKCAVGVEGSSATEKQVFPDSTDRGLSDVDLVHLGCDELWRARNEIFARNGYCFRNFEANRAFGNKGCTTTYDSLFGAESTQFKLLRSNVYKIQAFEALKQCRAHE